MADATPEFGIWRRGVGVAVAVIELESLDELPDDRSQERSEDAGLVSEFFEFIESGMYVFEVLSSAQEGD